MDLAFNFDALFKRVHGVFEEFTLMFVLLPDVWVDLPVFGLLVLDEVEKAAVYCYLELLVVVCVLNNLVNGVLEVVDVSLVVPDNVSVRLDGLLDDTLAQPQIFNHVAKAGINVVEPSQSLVHLLSLVLQVCDL